MSLGMDYIKWLYSIVLFPRIFIYYHLLVEITPSTFIYYYIPISLSFHYIFSLYIYIYLFPTYIPYIFPYLSPNAPSYAATPRPKADLCPSLCGNCWPISWGEVKGKKSMVERLTIWLYGLYMVYIWSIYGLYMVYIWSIYGLYMVYIWSIYGLYMVNG